MGGMIHNHVDDVNNLVMIINHMWVLVIKLFHAWLYQLAQNHKMDRIDHP